MRPRCHTLLLLGLAACAAPADFAYSETDALPGADLPTRLAHVSQLDLLPDTTGDQTANFEKSESFKFLAP